MVKESELHAEEDRRKREDVETRNMADSLAYNAEKTLRDLDGKIPADIRSDVEGKVSQVRSALQNGDTSQIKRAADDLQASLQKVGASVYGQGGAGEGGSAADTGGEQQPGGESPDGTVEGEFREV
jgi:molecular chaperone DnaK